MLVSNIDRHITLFLTGFCRRRQHPQTIQTRDRLSQTQHGAIFRRIIHDLFLSLISTPEIFYRIAICPYTSASSSHLRTMLSKSSSRPFPAILPTQLSHYMTQNPCTGSSSHLRKMLAMLPMSSNWPLPA